MACNKCNSNPCGCSSYSCSTPAPFYTQVPCCEEDNIQKIYYNQYALGLQIQSSWNVPQCGGAAILSVPGVTNIPVGSYLWNTSFGYFLVVSFDAVLQQVSIQNTCLTGNAVIGTAVPACTTFVITPPPCCTNDTNGVFVAIDFTAPADGDCLDITVTSEEGLSAGNDVQIGTGVYFLSVIKSNNIITICNTGEGAIAGTPIIAKDVNGNYQYPIFLITINPCNQPAITGGKVIGCDLTSSILSPIQTSNVDDILTVVNATTGESRFTSTEKDARVAADAVLQAEFDNLVVSSQDNTSVAYAATVNSGNTVETCQLVTVTYTNNSNNTVNYVYTVVGFIQGTATGANTDDLKLSVDLQVDSGSGYVSTTVTREDIFTRNDAAHRQDYERTFVGQAFIAPGATKTVTSKVVVTWLGSGSSAYAMSNFYSRITGILVGV